MGTQFAGGKFAIANCDRCGMTYLLKELKYLTIKLNRTALKVCNECWEADHPQWQTGMWPIEDPQALRSPRPDQSLAQIRAILNVVNIGVAGASYLGSVTITTV